MGYTDADGASQPHWHAILGYMFLIDGGAISWLSCKQELVTLSTVEAEYVAATHAAKEAVWLRRLIGELSPSLLCGTLLLCDNQAALKLATDDNYRARTKHINIRYHYIRQVISSGDIEIAYCPTEDMTVDILTKALPSWKIARHALSLGLRDGTATLAGEWRISVGRVLQDWEDAKHEAAAQAGGVGGGNPVLRRGTVVPAAGDREATRPTEMKASAI